MSQLKKRNDKNKGSLHFYLSKEMSKLYTHNYNINALNEKFYFYFLNKIFFSCVELEYIYSTAVESMLTWRFWVWSASEKWYWEWFFRILFNKKSGKNKMIFFYLLIVLFGFFQGGHGGHCDLKVLRSQAKLDESLSNYFSKTKANSMC